MIDLHVHILPGLDDGAKDLETALEMAELALKVGVNVLAATPHSNQFGRFENYYDQNLTDAFTALQQALKQEKLPIELIPGMEIFASEDIRDKIMQGVLIGLNRGRYFLVEFPFDADPYWIGEQLEKVQEAGKIPLIAHPERYFCVQDCPEIVYFWLQMGCFTQMNKGSIFGRFGHQTAEVAEVLLRNDLITCIASDAHGAHFRTTYMGDIREYLETNFCFGMADQLLHNHAGQILRGKLLRRHGRRPDERRKYFW
jgi:protein-tyrosine phosphatase